MIFRVGLGVVRDGRASERDDSDGERRDEHQHRRAENADLGDERRIERKLAETQSLQERINPHKCDYLLPYPDLRVRRPRTFDPIYTIDRISTMPLRPVVLLFRRDLRLSDNPALAAAAATGAPVLPLYVLDDAEPFAPGGAQRWWLHGSLEALSDDLRRRGAPLVLRRGRMAETVRAVVAEAGARAVYWNRRYAPALVEADAGLKSALSAEGIAAYSFSASLLREPWELHTQNDGFFRVFSPFQRALKAAGPSRTAAPDPPAALGDGPHVTSDHLAAWKLRPTRPNWAREFPEHWTPGEAEGKRALRRFLSSAAGAYHTERDRPDRASTSRLSPYLANGEISPIEIWDAVAARLDDKALSARAADKFLSELTWREFAYHLMFHQADIATTPMRPEFADFPYAPDPRLLRLWRNGETGYPIVDAGMRQLWRTGWMHNRVRLLAASFLTKHLLQPWQDGVAWFWDTLVDADMANNAMGWQWVAGSGADAAPYFRIFNPTLQGAKFDPKGDYVRRFVPELRNLPDDFIHRPWEAPRDMLDAASVRLGADYPFPAVDHGMARNRALDAFERLKSERVAHAQDRPYAGGDAPRH